MDSMLCDVDKKRSVPFAPIRRFLSLVPRSKRSDQSEQTRYAPFAHLRRFAAKVLSAMGQTILSGHDDLLPDDGGNFDDHDHLGPHEVIALSADHQYMVSVFTRNTLADLQYRLGNMALDDKNDISVSSSVDFLVEHLEGVPDALSEKVGKKPKESLRAPSASEGMLAKSLSE